MPMEHIRPYETKDRSAVERICIETAGPGFAETAARRAGTLAAFCQVYLDCSPQCCLVAVDGQDRPVGYILCAPDFAQWCRQIPRQFASGFPFGFWWNFGSMLEAIPFAKEYPAHLHINLLPGFQRKGLGRQLVDALEQALVAQNCPGVFLGVSEKNASAIRFYERCGFHVLGRCPGTVIYGKKIKSK